MVTRETLFLKILGWLQSHPDIKSAILVGSDTRKDHPSDEYSDYDIEIYTELYEKYTNDENWLNILGEVWVNVREKTDEGFLMRQEYPEKLDMEISKWIKDKYQTN